MIRGVADLLTQNTEIGKIRIIVHTHSLGSAKKDKRLGYQRGRTIIKILTKAGVDRQRLSVSNYGSSKSIASNFTKRGRLKNQRVYFKIR